MGYRRAAELRKHEVPSLHLDKIESDVRLRLRFRSLNAGMRLGSGVLWCCAP